MKTSVYRCLFALFVGSFLLAAAPSGWAQTRPGTKIDVFKTVKPGQWVQIEGVPQKDFTVLATEIKFLTGDFEDDDWEVLATVRGVNKAAKEFEILLMKVKVNDGTEYQTKDQTRTFKSFDDLKPGMFVELEGTYLKDGVFLAEEVQDETARKEEEAGTVTFVGKAEKVDPIKRTVTLMKTTFIVSDKTQAKSAIK